MCNDDYGDAFDALLQLAGKDTERGSKTLLSHEIKILDASLDIICTGHGPGGTLIAVLLRAFHHSNTAIARRLLLRLRSIGATLHHHSAILVDLLLHASAIPGKTEYLVTQVVELALQCGAKVNGSDEAGRTPIYLACARGYRQIFDLLITSGADTYEPAKYRIGELHELRMVLNPQTRSNRREDWKPDIGKKHVKQYEEYMDLLQLTCFQAQCEYFAGTFACEEIAFRLLDLGHRPFPGSPEMVFLYPALCRTGDLKRLQVLLEDVSTRALVVDSRFCFGMMLQQAVMSGNEQVVGLLLQAGADPTEPSLMYHGHHYRDPSVQDDKCFETAVATAVHYCFPDTSLDKVYNACDLLAHAGVSQTDREHLLAFAARNAWHDRVDDLLSRDIRLEELPLCDDPRIVHALIKTGSRYDDAELLHYALHANAGQLLAYLADSQGLCIEAEQFGEVALDLIRAGYGREPYTRDRRQPHTLTLMFLMDRFGYTADTPFTVNPCHTPCQTTECCRRLGASCDTAVQTNLLRLACIFSSTLTVRWLLTDGEAHVDCPGFPESAVEYTIQNVIPDRGHRQDHGQVLLLLVKYSSPELIRRYYKVLSEHVQRYAEEMKETHPLLRKPEAPISLHLKPSTGVTYDMPSEVNCFEGTHPFEYEKLKGLTPIRLFHLEPAADPSSIIVGSITHHQLTNVPPFEALSYVWGSMDNPCTISLNKEALTITNNLAQALSRIRRHDNSRTLWIDAICLNQSDNEEKGQQVAMMSEIYRMATCTLIFIGEADRYSKAVYEHLHSITPSPDVPEPPGFGYDQYERFKLAFKKVVQRPWFSRTWVIQEYALSASSLLLCGSDSITTDRLRGSGPWAGRDHFALTSWSDFKQVIERARYCYSTDPRDKVYGVLGMLGRPLMDVDYDAPVDIVYLKFSAAIIQDQNNLEVLHWMGPRQDLQGLASWIPKWDTVQPPPPLPRVFETDKPPRRYGPYPEPDHAVVSFDGNELTARGIRFDRVQVLATPLISNSESERATDFIATMNDWEQTVLPYIRERGIDSLTAFARALSGRDQKREDNDLMVDLRMFFNWYWFYASDLLANENRDLFNKIRMMIALLEGYKLERDCRPIQKFRLSECVSEFAERVEKVCYQRRFMVTEKGSMGLAPCLAQAGDQIVFLLGGLYAFVVRAHEEQNGKWLLIGDCLLEDLDIANIKQQGVYEDFAFV